MSLTLSESRDVLRFSLTALEMFHLDEVWTARAVAGLAPAADESDESLVKRLHELIDEMSQGFGTLQEIHHAHHVEAAASLDELLWSSAFPRADREDLRWWIVRHGGLDAMAERLATLNHPYAVEREHALLEDEWQLVRRGVASSGDLSRSWVCGTAQGMFVGGVVAIPSGLAGGLAAGAATGLVAGLAVGATGGLGGVAICAYALWWARRHKC